MPSLADYFCRGFIFRVEGDLDEVGDEFPAAARFGEADVDSLDFGEVDYEIVFFDELAHGVLERGVVLFGALEDRVREQLPVGVPGTHRARFPGAVGDEFEVVEVIVIFLVRRRVGGRRSGLHVGPGIGPARSFGFDADHGFPEFFREFLDLHLEYFSEAGHQIVGGGRSVEKVHERFLVEVEIVEHRRHGEKHSDEDDDQRQRETVVARAEKFYYRHFFI